MKPSAKKSERIEHAIEVAKSAHEGQSRKTGEPYIVHPLAVQKILEEWGMDEDTIIAGILHDTIEDTDVTDEPETEGQPEEAEEQEPETETGKVTVTVLTSMSNETEMKLEAVVNDPLNRDFLYQWQVSEDGGANYRDMENETNANLSVELTEDNIHNLWRVKVQFL